MNAAEIKLDLFRRLDSLENSKLEAVYNKIIKLLSTDSTDQENISPEVQVALDEALEASKQGRVYSHADAMQQTKDKYPNLFQ